MRASSQHRSAQRRSVVLATVILVFAILVAACGPVEAPPPAGAPGSPPDAITATVYNRTNADRAAHGLGGLAWNARLAGLAGEWSRYLADTHQFSHRDLAAAIDSPGFEAYSGLGENILVGPSGINGDQMENAWLASPGHYANIMGNYDSIGVAIAYGNDGNVRAVANFGRHY
jgi:uncharacterized protein YkwD